MPEDLACTASPHDYWDDRRHVTWQQHYLSDAGCHLLAFSHWWRFAHLPPDGFFDLRQDLKDTRDGRVYVGLPLFVRTEQSQRILLDNHGDFVSHMTLRYSTYAQQHGGSDRAVAINNLYPGFDYEAMECHEFKRVLHVVRIYTPLIPNLVLYSETMTSEELEAGLVPAEEKSCPETSGQ